MKQILTALGTLVVSAALLTSVASAQTPYGYPNQNGYPNQPQGENRHHHHERDAEAMLNRLNLTPQQWQQIQPNIQQHRSNEQAMAQQFLGQVRQILPPQQQALLDQQQQQLAYQQQYPQQQYPQQQYPQQQYPQQQYPQQQYPQQQYPQQQYPQQYPQYPNQNGSGYPNQQVNNPYNPPNTMLTMHSASRLLRNLGLNDYQNQQVGQMRQAYEQQDQQEQQQFLAGIQQYLYPQQQQQLNNPETHGRDRDRGRDRDDD